eukprot:6438429-Amphidinium_carterae.2
MSEMEIESGHGKGLRKHAAWSARTLSIRLSIALRCKENQKTTAVEAPSRKPLIHAAAAVSAK